MSLAAVSHDTIYGLTCLRGSYILEILIIDGRIIFAKFPGPLLKDSYWIYLIYPQGHFVSYRFAFFVLQFSDRWKYIQSP